MGGENTCKGPAKTSSIIIVISSATNDFRTIPQKEKVTQQGPNSV